MDIKSFLKIEKKYNLYEDTIEGIHYWNYSRFGIWGNYILKQNLGLGTAHNQNKNSALKNIKIYFDLLINAVSAAFTRIKQQDVCIINHPRKVLNDGKYECIYTDEFVANINNYVVLERPYQLQHYKPAKTHNIKYLDILTVEKILYYRVFRMFFKKKYNKLIRKIETKIEKPLQDIEEVYGIKLDSSFVAKYVAEQIIFYKANIRTIEHIVKKINPRVLVEVVSYSFDCMIFTEGCKKNNIPVIELQHGILTNHIAYNYDTDREVAQIPDRILLFADYWKTYVKWPIESENIIATGYPYFERKIKEARKIEKYDDDKLNIIFISQGTIGKKLSEAAIELSKLLDKEQYRIFYKLHPGEYSIWKEKYKGLEDGNIIVLSDNKVSLYDYLATCQIQIGVYSTALYEGLGFGLKTYIYMIEMSEQMEKLNEVGYVTYFSDAEELQQYIYQDLEEKKCIPDGQNFWEKDALNNIIKYIESLLKNL